MKSQFRSCGGGFRSKDGRQMRRKSKGAVEKEGGMDYLGRGEIMKSIPDDWKKEAIVKLLKNL